MYTKHAQCRIQQRGIPPIALELLTMFGDEYYDGHGCIKVLFSKRSIKRMESELGMRSVSKLGKLLCVYQVESVHDGRVITCAHQTKRHRRR